MKVHDWNAVSPLPELHGGYVTLGNFDGVHRGHVALLHQLVEWAAAEASSMACDLPPTVAITFRQHPRHVLGDVRPQTLVPFDRRLELMAATGLAHAIVIPFTRDFSMLSAEQFVLQALCEGLGARGVLLGWNSFFGHNRRGNLAFLQEHGPPLGLEVHGQDPILVDHAPISSSRIRHAIREGDLESAARLLGRQVTITGEVVHGDARGRTIGYPTANLRPQQDVIPPRGVYLCAASLDDGSLWPALTNIGVRPTFGAQETLCLETWLDGFEGDLYGRRVTVHMLRHLRGETRFRSPAELVQALNGDRDELRRAVDEAWPPPGLRA